MQVFIGSHLPLYCKYLLSNFLSQQQGFPFLLAKKMLRSRLRRGGSGQQKNRFRLLGSTLKVKAPAPKHCSEDGLALN